MKAKPLVRLFELLPPPTLAKLDRLLAVLALRRRAYKSALTFSLACSFLCLSALAGNIHVYNGSTDVCTVGQAVMPSGTSLVYPATVCTITSLSGSVVVTNDWGLTPLHVVVTDVGLVSGNQQSPAFFGQYFIEGVFYFAAACLSVMFIRIMVRVFRQGSSSDSLV